MQFPFIWFDCSMESFLVITNCDSDHPNGISKIQMNVNEKYFMTSFSEFISILVDKISFLIYRTKKMVIFYDRFKNKNNVRFPVMFDQLVFGCFFFTFMFSVIVFSFFDLYFKECLFLLTKWKCTANSAIQMSFLERRSQFAWSIWQSYCNHHLPLKGVSLWLLLFESMRCHRCCEMTTEYHQLMKWKKREKL